MAKCLRLFLRVVLVAVALGAVPAQAQTACIFDIMGAQGDVYAMARDYALEVKRMGISLKLKPYTNERVALEDFKAGQCDGAIMTGLRGRQFNQFTGSIDSVGSLPTYKHMRTVVELLASPKSARAWVQV